MTAEVFPCLRCGVDHGEPPFDCNNTIVVILDGPHKGKMGIAIEWRRYNGPTWIRVVLGVAAGGHEIRDNFDPCQLQEWRS